MVVEKFQYKVFSYFFFIVEMVEDGVVLEGGLFFVYYLGLFLWVEILVDFMYDVQDFVLLWFEQWGVFFYKVQQVFLWFGRVVMSGFNCFFFFVFWQGVLQYIYLVLQIFFLVFLLCFFFLQRDFLWMFIVVDVVVYQCVVGVEQFFYFVDVIVFFVFGDVFMGKDQIVDD